MNTLPLPPFALRELVGPRDPEHFDNPSGEPVYPDLPAAAYDTVFDFGCGCGRLARKMLQQTPRPRRYVGIDVHRTLVEWATANLTPADPHFRFEHHDVWSPGPAAGNGYRLAAPLPLGDGQATLAIAHSVFTHLSRQQAEYYLWELSRILSPAGYAFTSWFFFDNASCPFLPDGPHALYADEKDFSAAVLYDRNWFLDTIRRAGLVVHRTDPPEVAGHQWTVWLRKRTTDSATDQFPVGDEGAEWVCGATRRPMAVADASEEDYRAVRTGSRQATAAATGVTATAPPVPPLFGPLAELAQVKAELIAMREELGRWKKRALLWRLGRKVGRLVIRKAG